MRTFSAECASRKKFSLCGSRTMFTRNGHTNLLYRNPVGAPYFGLWQLWPSALARCDVINQFATCSRNEAFKGLTRQKGLACISGAGFRMPAKCRNWSFSTFRAHAGHFRSYPESCQSLAAQY